MRTLFFLLDKEFRQLMRNRQLLMVLLIAPLIQLILLPLAVNYTVKNISIAVVDHDQLARPGGLRGDQTTKRAAGPPDRFGMHRADHPGTDDHRVHVRLRHGDPESP